MNRRQAARPLALGTEHDRPRTRRRCLLAVRYDVRQRVHHALRSPRCVRLLAGSTVKPSATIAFRTERVPPRSRFRDPEGFARWRRRGRRGGEREPRGQRRLRYVRDELAEITQHVHAARAKIKVIFETCFLDEAQKSHCARSAVTSAPIGRRLRPGSAPRGNRHDVALLRARCPADVQIKASGGIRDLDTVLAFAELGATR